MQCDEKKQSTKESDIGLLIFYEGMMNKRFVAMVIIGNPKLFVH